MVRLEFPLLVSVTLLELELPAFTLPKLRLVGLADSVTEAAIPVPLNEIVVGEFGALLVIVTVPARFPAVVGANTALNVVLAPAATVLGVASPFTLYPEPLTASCEIVSDALPVLVTVNVCDFVCPSTTLPKAKLAGETPNPACTPVPFTGIVRGDPLASLVTVTLPVALPAAVGANTMFNVAVDEGFKVAGVVMPFTVKPVPVAAIFEICTAALPVFVRTTCCVELEPVATLPKLTEVGFACNWPTGVVEPVPLKFTIALGVFGSLLVIVTLPLAAPEAVGWNVRAIDTDWPALTVLGVATPLSPNSAPVNETIEIVRSLPPLFEIVTVALPVDPTPTVPN